MNYFEYTIETTALGADLLPELLAELGVMSVQVTGPSEEPLRPTEYLSDEVKEREAEEPYAVIFYLEADDIHPEEVSPVVLQLQERLAALRSEQGALYGSLTLSRKLRGDEEWKDRWKAYFHATKVSERFAVCPSWETREPEDAREIVLTIDPGMAFGTGTHETTSLTLRLLEKYLQEGDTVIDVGCGTGILSIAASKLGASEVLGIDIEEEAVEASRENFERNNVGNAEARLGDLTKDVSMTADLVVANLLTNLVMELTADISKHLRDGGFYLMSGILTEHEARVRECLAANGFTVAEVLTSGEWIAISARKDA